MKIHWNNIAVVLLGIVGLVVCLRAGPAIQGYLSNIKNIGPGHSATEQTQGVIALAFLVATFIAVFRLLLNNKNN